MPIYAYRCSTCGYAKDVLQKMSDPVLSVCPECGNPTFQKQVTAAGFQLKGSGWYVTDFRGGDKPPASDAKTGDGKTGNADGPAKSDAKPAESGAGPAKADAAPAPAPAPVAPPPSTGTK